MPARRIPALLLGAMALCLLSALADAAVATGPSEPATAPADFLDFPITCCVKRWSVEQAIDLLLDQLPTQDGVRLELMPFGADEPSIDLACDRTPLRMVLDDIARQSGWRWRARGRVVYVDHPCRNRPALLAKLDPARPETPMIGERDVLTLARAGDLDVCGKLLAFLADPRCGTSMERDAAAGRSFQLSLLHDLAEAGATWQDWLPRGNPLGWLAGDPQAKRGVVAAWRRCVKANQAIPPFLCYLAGELEVTELGDDLLSLARHPEDAMPDLAAAGGPGAEVLGRTRQWAIRALGRMHYAKADDELLRILRQDPGGPAAEAAAAALGELRVLAATPVIAALDPGDDWRFAAMILVAMDRIDPTAVLPLVQAKTSLLRGLPMLFMTRPRIDLLPQTLRAPPPEAHLGQNAVFDDSLLVSSNFQGDWAHWVGLSLWQGTGRLPRDSCTAILRAQAEMATDPGQIPYLLARDGDDQILDRFATTDPWWLLTTQSLIKAFPIAERVAARLSPSRSARMVDTASRSYAHDADPVRVPNLLAAVRPVEVQARVLAEFPRHQLLAYYLAGERTPEARAALMKDLAAVAATQADLRDPVLRRSVAGSLGGMQDPRAAGQLAMELAFHRDTAPIALAFLVRTPPAENAYQLACHVERMLEEPDCSPHLHDAHELAAATVPVLMKWLAQSENDGVRIWAASALLRLLHGDLRRQRVEAIDLLVAIARDPAIGGRSDQRLSGMCRGAIALLIDETSCSVPRDRSPIVVDAGIRGQGMRTLYPSTPDGEIAAEQAIMAGSLDDHASVRELVDARQRAIDSGVYRPAGVETGPQRF